jgi:hypothetical protein
MNPAYEHFLALPDRERRDVFNAAAERLDTLPIYIEKDFWVCRVLDGLYHGLPDDHPRLLFKGGTSLSKAFGAIRRFSEDIDVVVFRNDLGFTDDRDPTRRDLSHKARERLVGELKESASRYICMDLATCLSELFVPCKIAEDEEDVDRSTLLVQYPSLYASESDAYVAPRVKIEGGARSAWDPHAGQTVTPYIQEELGEMALAIGGVPTLAPERTFLEKALILHGWHCGYRDQERLPDDRHRLSRHYYDMSMMARTAIAERALENQTLLNQVRDHTLAFFRRGWMKLEEARPGSIHLMPQDALATFLAGDYDAMQGMILGESPPFEDILRSISDLETRINVLPSSS